MLKTRLRSRPCAPCCAKARARKRNNPLVTDITYTPLGQPDASAGQAGQHYQHQHGL